MAMVASLQDDISAATATAATATATVASRPTSYQQEHPGASTSRVIVDTPLLATPTNMTDNPATNYFVPVQPSWPPEDAQTHYVLLSSFPAPPNTNTTPTTTTIITSDSEGDSVSANEVSPPRRILLFTEQPPLPPYMRDVEDPSPAYERVNRNPDTLARHLFQFGFIFPPLWILNVIIIMHPLQVHPADESDVNSCKTEEERREELAIMRAIELRWARRSAVALVVFSLLVALILVLVLVLGRRRRG